jgi:hypothetical protein
MNTSLTFSAAHHIPSHQDRTGLVGCKQCDKSEEDSGASHERAELAQANPVSRELFPVSHPLLDAHNLF